MINSKLSENSKLLVGCGAGIILLFAIFAVGMTFAFRADRAAAHYPGATLVSSNSNYKGLPTHYTWNDSFTTTDDFNTVFSWYSIKFDMGPESRANGSCALLETNDELLLAERYMGVFVCQTDDGLSVFVNRATSFR